MDSGSTMMAVAIVILVILSAFFSATETAYTSVNHIRLKTLADDNKRAARAVKQLEKYDKLLSTVLVGNNIVNILMASLGTLFFARILTGVNEANAVTVSTIVITIVVLVFGEITPKTLAKRSSESFVLAVSPIVSFIVTVFTPVTAVFECWRKLVTKVYRAKDDDSITEDELLSYVEEAQEDGEIDEHESELIKNAIEFNDCEAEEILTPRVDIVAVPKDAPIDEIRNTFHEHRFSRLPVYVGTIDNIIGVIHEKDFYYNIYHNISKIDGIINRVFCVAKTTPISQLLRKFQQEKSHIAVVVDEYGGTLGLVTMEDVLEELVGEIYDEHDEVVQEIVKLSDDKYKISCAVSLDDMFALFGMDEEYEEASTVNGWLLEEMEKIPEVGDSFDYKGKLHIEILKRESRRVVEITVEKLPDEDEEEKD